MSSQKKKHKRQNAERRKQNRGPGAEQQLKRPKKISKRKMERMRAKEARNAGEPIKFKAPIHINPGIFVFLVLFGYIIVMVILYLKSTPVTPYEVKLGSLAVNNKYEGVILREELVVNSDYSGYINYYAREDEKVSKGAMVYTVDSSGKLSEIMGGNDGEGSSLSETDLSELKTEISSFSTNFKPRDFKSTYDFKYDIEGTVLKLANSNVLLNIDTLRNQNYADSIDFGYAPESGIIVYSTDGYEGLNPEDLTDEMFDYEIYAKHQFHSNDLTGQNDPAYKLVTSELWSVVVEVEENRALELESESYVEVRFLKNNYTSWAAVSILRQNGKTYALLEFNNSMVTFATDRFIEIEILDKAQEGLKVPQSAIVERPFYLIPLDYLTYGNNIEETGFIKESYLEDGSISSQFVPATIYNSNDEDYYVDQETFSVGDYIIMPTSEERYPISRQANLIGVYNINKGYADFKQITIINENDEYAIVKSNSEYGLSVYDHIVLNGDSVSANDFIYE